VVISQLTFRTAPQQLANSWLTGLPSMWNSDDLTFPVIRLIRWDEKAGLQRDAIRSQ
jgi:hypothetical protein